MPASWRLGVVKQAQPQRHAETSGDPTPSWLRTSVCFPFHYRKCFFLFDGSLSRVLRRIVRVLRHTHLERPAGNDTSHQCCEAIVILLGGTYRVADGRRIVPIRASSQCEGEQILGHGVNKL